MTSSTPSPTLLLHGTVVPGHGVASGRALNSPYPQGSVAMQMPFFKARGLDLSHCWAGTLNVSVAPKTWSVLHADYCFAQVTWTHLHPPETFSFVSLQLLWRTQSIDAWLYYPHPETKAAHHQNASVMEIIAPRLDGLTYGDSLTLQYTTGALLVG
jgi:hypothetical protein